MKIGHAKKSQTFFPEVCQGQEFVCFRPPPPEPAGVVDDEQDGAPGRGREGEHVSS